MKNKKVLIIQKSDEYWEPVLKKKNQKNFFFVLKLKVTEILKPVLIYKTF